MASDPAALVVRLQADFKQFSNTMKQAGLVSDRAVRDIEDKFSRMNPRLTWATTLGNVLGNTITASVTALFGAMQKLHQEMLSLDKAARTTGLSYQKLQELAYAGAQFGIDPKDMYAALPAVKKAIDDAATSGGELGRILDQNTVKWKDQGGAIIDANSAIVIAADLISRANSEADKKAIAKAFDIPESFIAMLERGSGEILTMSRNATAAGAIIDQELIKAASQFDAAWSQAADNLAVYVKRGTLRAANYLSLLWADMKKLGAGDFSATPGNWNTGPISAQQSTFGTLPTKFNGPQTPGSTALQRELNKRYNQATSVEKPKAAKGGGGGGSEPAHRLDSVESYINALQRQVDVQRLEYELQGKSNAEREIAIALAEAEAAARRRGTDLTAEETAKIRELAAARGALMDKIKGTQGLYSASNFAGGELISVLEAATKGGNALEQALQGVIQALIRAALQAAILGQGPLAGVLGLAGAGGAPGGAAGLLLGAIGPGRASGGPVQAGRLYPVGENGPELVRFGRNGAVIPNQLASRAGGDAPAAPVFHNRTFNIDARGAQLGVGEQIRAALTAYDRQLERQLPARLGRSQKRYT